MPNDKDSAKNLSPCHQEIPLRDGVKLVVSYSLIKGRNNKCVCGVSQAGELESYFETIDDATMLIKVTNKGNVSLRHLHATRFKILKNSKELTDRLPDGNLLFELDPDDRYFGDLPIGGSVEKDVVLITRGTAPGEYEVSVEFTYDIEGCSTSALLSIAVCPD